MISRISNVRIRTIMAKNGNGVKLKFEGIESIGSQPPLVYWLSNNPLRQYFVFALALLCLISPIGVLCFGYFTNFMLLQQIGLITLIPAILLYTFVNEALTTIKYIENAEACRIEQVAACNKISKLNEIVVKHEAISNNMKEEIAGLLEARANLQQEVDALMILKQSGQKNDQAIDELSEALEKFIAPYKDEDADRNELNGFIEKITEIISTLKTHGHQVNITSQDYLSLKGLLFQFFALPEKYVAQVELSQEVIKGSDDLLHGLSTVLNHVFEKCTQTKLYEKKGTLNDEEAFIVDVGRKILILKERIEAYKNEHRNPEKTSELSKLNNAKIPLSNSGIAGNLFQTISLSFSKLVTPSKGGPH